MNAELAWYLLALSAAWSLHDIARDLRALRRHTEREPKR